MNEKEEVKKAVMELKIFGNIDLENCQNEAESAESQDDMQTQVRFYLFNIRIRLT